MAQTEHLPIYKRTDDLCGHPDWPAVRGRNRSDRDRLTPRGPPGLRRFPRERWSGTPKGLPGCPSKPVWPPAGPQENRTRWKPASDAGLGSARSGT